MREIRRLLFSRTPLSKLSDRMARHVANWKSTKVICSFFVIAMAWIVLFLLQLNSQKVNLNSRSVDLILISELPVNALELKKNLSQDTSHSLRRILAFSAYLDSLQRTQNDAAFLDSLRKVRPGLLDSIKLIIYQLQRK